MKIIVMVMLIPNTYETYWNTSAIKFVRQTFGEYRNFDSRWAAKAKEQGLTTIEATILKYPL
jgi:UPF0755 protein